MACLGVWYKARSTGPLPVMKSLAATGTEECDGSSNSIGDPKALIGGETIWELCVCGLLVVDNIMRCAGGGYKKGFV